ATRSSSPPQSAPGRSTTTTTSWARARSTTSPRRSWSPAPRTTSPWPLRRSARASSSTATRSADRPASRLCRWSGESGQNEVVARILLGVTGGIAAYKACELTRFLVKAGHDVIPLVTRGAEEFVTAKTFAALARRPLGDDPFPHLERADLLVVAPCTANTLAKLAQGIADNVLTEAALAHRGPVIVAPAMNHRMWSHPATRANAETLRARGVVLVGPDEGETAEGD